MDRWLLAALVSVALALTPTTASAQYLDPGASSVLVQVIIAGLVGVAAVLKLYWRRISGFISSWRKPRAGAGVDRLSR